MEAPPSLDIQLTDTPKKRIPSPAAAAATTFQCGGGVTWSNYLASNRRLRQTDSHLFNNRIPSDLILISVNHLEPPY